MAESEFIFILKFIFTGEFFMFLYLFYLTLKKDLYFHQGFMLGILYFIYVPGSILLLTNKLEVSRLDYAGTYLNDILLPQNNSEFLTLVLYLFSLIIFFFIEISKYSYPSRSYRIYKRLSLAKYWKLFFLFGLILNLVIFIATRIYSGGHWYITKYEWLLETGELGLILDHMSWSSKLLFISALLFSLQKDGFKFQYILVLLIFIMLDVLTTGNRVFAFLVLAGIAMIILKEYKIKAFVFLLIILLPFGYFFSIYRYLRVLIFIEGLPNFSRFLDLIRESATKISLNAKDLLLSISESININVIFNLFNYTSADTFIKGATFLKPFTFFIPRSLWSSKPYSVTIIAGNLFSNSEYLALVTTIIGEIHLNFYYLGILLLPIVLYMYNKLLGYFLKDSDVSGNLKFLMGILIFRMPFSDVFIDFFFTILLIKLTRLLPRKGRLYTAETNSE